MLFVPLSFALLSSSQLPSVLAQQSTYPATPLASKTFSYPSGIPYKVDKDDNLIRGGQLGYNLCNSTTESQTSLCQTSFMNHLDDFCLWGPSRKDSVVADTEGEMVAWCTKAGRGTRLIPEGALKGLQYMKTPDYVQIVGFIDQTEINIAAGDFGGEMDPHGADLRGNPLGGLMFSNAWSGSNDTYTQAIEWHNFIGSDSFCLKLCDPAGANAANYCQHIYDRIGCAYNAPNNAQNLTFEACEGANQDFPGIYTSDGVVMTYTQPAESLGAITTMPYTAVVPASSNCVTFQSTALFTDLVSVAASGVVPSATTAAGTAGATGEGSTTGTSTAGTTTESNGAAAVVITSVSVIGIIFSLLFLA